MDCPNLELDFTDCYRGGHYCQDTFYDCALTGEGCSLYYDGFCNGDNDE